MILPPAVTIRALLGPEALLMTSTFADRVLWQATLMDAKAMSNTGSMVLLMSFPGLIRLLAARELDGFLCRSTFHS
jgi:hypothetical protein